MKNLLVDKDLKPIAYGLVIYDIEYETGFTFLADENGYLKDESTGDYSSLGQNFWDDTDIKYYFDRQSNPVIGAIVIVMDD